MIACFSSRTTRARVASHQQQHQQSRPSQKREEKKRDKLLTAHEDEVEARAREDDAQALQCDMQRKMIDRGKIEGGEKRQIK